MEFDDEDILSLAIESVENDTSFPSNSDKSIVLNDNIVLNGSSNSRNHDKNLSDDDILAHSLEDVDKVASGNPEVRKVRSLVGVDLCFEAESEEHVPGPDICKKLDSKKNDSVVHTGDTDSSDDEDNRNYLESRYDSYGKSLKKSLQDHVKRKQFGAIGRDSWKGKSNSSPLQKSNILNKLDTKPKPSAPTEKLDVTADPIFGIRIINPLVSSQTIREAMHRRTPIGCFKIKSHVMHGDLKADWVFAAVLVHKLPPRTSQKGNTYSMWILSDLKNDLKTVLLFLFGKAHDELWKTPSGVVLAVLNPSVLGDDKKSDYEAKLSISSADQVMIWGKSKDLGQCKSRKKNGDICGKFVNIASCEFCVYHVKQEYKKYNSRADFGNGSRTNLQNKILGKNEVFYGGKSFTATANMGKKATNPKDAIRLQALGSNSIPSLSTNMNVQIPNLQRSNEILKLLPKGTMNKLTDEKRLKQLGVKSDSSSEKLANFIPKLSNLSALSKMKKISLSNPGDGINLDIDYSSKSKSKEHLTTKNFSSNKLQKKFNSLLGISSEREEKKKTEFSSTLPSKQGNPLPVTLTQQSSSSPTNSQILKKSLKETHVSPASNTNLKVLSSNANVKECIDPMSLEKSDFQHPEAANPDEILKLPSCTTSTLSKPSQLNQSQRKTTSSNSRMSMAKLKALAFVKNMGPIDKHNPTGLDPNKKGNKRPLSNSDDEHEDDKKPILSQRFIELMNQKSVHEDLVEIRELEQEEEYFNKMEKKDRLEEKMLNTFKIECKAVRCLKCNYIWFSASDTCKAERHPMKVVDAMKRFFKCGKCDNRTVSLTVIPLIPCKKCFSSNWVRAPMIREKLAKNNELSIRGGEQKFFNSVSTNGSLDLLVPD